MGTREPFALGPVAAAPGERVRGWLPVVGGDLELPVSVVNGVRDGPTLLVTAGVHGGEYPAIDAAVRFARELDPARLAGRVAVIHLTSPTSFYARRQYRVPEDDRNLNRVFPGRADGTLSERIAHTVMTEAVRAGGVPVDAWIDLHGGDIHEALLPFVCYAEAGPAELRARVHALAEAFGIPLLVPPSDLSGATVNAAAAAGVPCLLAEAGGEGALDPASTELLLRGCRNVASSLGMIPGGIDAVPLTRVARWSWLLAEARGSWRTRLRPGDRVAEGEVVGTLSDPFGEVFAEPTTSLDGVVLFVVTSLAVDANDPLLAVVELPS